MSIRTYHGKTPILGKEVYIDETAVLIGDVKIGDECSIWPCAVVRGDVNQVCIGNRSNIQDGCILHVSHVNQETHCQGTALIVGEDVTIGHNAVLHGCTIGDRVLIGMGSVILDNVVIGHDVIVGAGSVVPPGKQLNSGYLYLGNPVRQIRSLIESEKELLLSGCKYYIQLKNTYK